MIIIPGAARSLSAMVAGKTFNKTYYMSGSIFKIKKAVIFCMLFAFLARIRASPKVFNFLD